jgi:hypothetical protein
MKLSPSRSIINDLMRNQSNSILNNNEKSKINLKDKKADFLARIQQIKNPIMNQSMDGISPNMKNRRLNLSSLDSTLHHPKMLSR